MGRWSFARFVFLGFVFIESGIDHAVSVEPVRQRHLVAFKHRLSLDVFLADHLSHRADRFDLVAKIRNVEKSSLLQTDIDEGSLHTRQDTRYPSFIDIADEAPPLVSLK